MDINTDLTYVTCLYDDLFGTEFGGRPDPVWRRYYYGLESLTKMMVPIVIFTWPTHVEKVETYYRNFLGEDRFNKQMKVLPFDLYQSPFYELIKTVKTEMQGYKNDRSYDLMIARFLFLKHVIQQNYFKSKYIFLIDAGLSHSALFPNKYLDKSDMDRQYTECSLFTPIVVTESIKRCKDTLLFIRCNAIGHWLPPKYTNPDTLNNDNLWYIIGGYFGGMLEKVDVFCSTIIENFQKIIKEDQLLLLDEQLTTLHVSYNQEQYVYETFDCWVHEDSGDWVKEFIVGKKNFYKIFEEFNKL